MSAAPWLHRRKGRCLHTMPAMRLEGGLPGGRGETARRRLIPATHGLLPMGQPLMRRDETRAAQRGIDGRSEPVGLAGLKAARLDKGLTRGYLDGRFGGIPTAGKAGSRGQKEGQPPRRKTGGRGHRAACRMSAEGQTGGLSIGAVLKRHVPRCSGGTNQLTPRGAKVATRNAKTERDRTGSLIPEPKAAGDPRLARRLIGGCGGSGT